ncbi:MAG: DUF2382 domain-containing protein [Methanosarcina sp.]
MTHTVIGFFKDSTDAHNAADVLKDHGFDNSNIDISADYGSYEDKNDQNERTSKVGNFFKSLFSNDDDADRYSTAARDNYLVTVHASSVDEAQRASEILDDAGALDVNENYPGNKSDSYERGYASEREYGRSNTGSILDADKDYNLRADASLTSDRDYDMNRDLNLDSDADYAHDRDINETSERDFDRERDFDLRDRDRDEASIPIIEEDVNIGKKEVRRGGVRIRSRIIERPVEETLRLREEHVQVERTPVDRDASDAELNDFREETIEVTEYGEEPIISKKARVVEEIKVGKQVHERKETVRGTKRKTEVDIEDLEKPLDDRTPDTE